jgi:hypothetical protein
MAAVPNTVPLEKPMPLFVRLVCLLLLLVPPGVLGMNAAQTIVGAKPILVGMAVFCICYSLFMMKEKGIWRAATHKFTAALFAISAGILFYAKVEPGNMLYMSAGGLAALALIVAILPWAHSLSSIERRARNYVARLAARTHWPEDIASCERLPEVKLLQDLIHHDAEPALMVLNHPRPQVRMVLLSSLQGRAIYAPGQAERILAAAYYAQEPVVRAAALRALANVREPHLLQRMSEFAVDSALEVRRATAEAMVYNAHVRWMDTRRYIHAALNDRRFIEDGPLPVGLNSLPMQALDDLSVWACEPGATSRRSMASLMGYYRTTLHREQDPELLQRLYSQMLDAKLHSTLRVEVAFLLRDQACLNQDVMRRMLEYHQPSQIRLLASAELLNKGFDELALETLREVARQPNREIALGVAQVLQATMAIDMGLDNPQIPPPSNSKQAAEVARRVVLWTQGKWPVGDVDADGNPVVMRKLPESGIGSSHNSKLAKSSLVMAMPVKTGARGIIETPWLE